MLTIEIEFKDGRRIETEEVSDFNFPWGDSNSQFVTAYGKNGELLYAINASEILVMAVEYNDDDKEAVKNGFADLGRAFENSTVEATESLSEIQKFLETNGFNV
jgi:hypothetical protein